MNSKIAMRVQFPELRECSCCHDYSGSGYILRDSSMSRFVCDECYSRFSHEYIAASKIVEISGNALSKLLPHEGRLGFHAGYLIGRKEAVTNGYRISVVSFLNSTGRGRATASYFCRDDTLRIRKEAIEKGLEVVGIFRTSPSGAGDFNSLDEKTLNDILYDILYVVIGGGSEIQIKARDKSGDEDAIGVLIT